MTRRARIHDDSGLTLIEMLVVLVIMPVVIGAIAIALITSFDNQSSTTNRLSDSVNSQISSVFFVRDVQTATYVTKLDNSANTAFYSNGPQVCAPASKGTFLVAFFHPATAGAPALDVSYWVDGTGSAATLDRYSCTLNATSYTSTSPTKLMLASTAPGSVLQGSTEKILASVEVRPNQFDSSAQAGWITVSASTTVASVTALPAGTIAVSSTFGFTVGTKGGVVCAPTSTVTSNSGCSGQVITIATTSGPAQVSCTGFATVPGGATFTGCTGGTGTAVAGAAVTQYNISGVQVSVTEPATNYLYSLLGSPAASSTGPSSPSASGAPALLTLGSAGINPINGGGSALCASGARANICVNGAVVLDGGGSVVCTGGGPHGYIDAPGGIASVAPPGDSSCNGLNVGTTPGVPDPLAPFLPACVSTSWLTNYQGSGYVLPTDPPQVSGVSFPGIYMNTAPSGKLEPGLYVVEKGVGSISGMVTPSSSDKFYQVPYNSGVSKYDATAGALFYVPGTGYGTGCLSATATGLSSSLSGVVPLDSNQSSAIFGGNPALGHVWLWQDAANNSGDSFSGSTNGGMAYLPAATLSGGGSYSLTTGEMIANSVQLNGTPNLILTGT